MPSYTVIGVYDSDGKVFADQVEAEDAWAAMRVSAVASQGSSDLQILGAVEGHATLTPACDDSGKAAYACDLTEDEGDDLCDFCMSSGVTVDHTHDGKTVCTECAKDCDQCRAQEPETTEGVLSAKGEHEHVHTEADAGGVQSRPARETAAPGEAAAQPRQAAQEPPPNQAPEVEVGAMKNKRDVRPYLSLEYETAAYLELLRHSLPLAFDRLKSGGVNLQLQADFWDAIGKIYDYLEDIEDPDYDDELDYIAEAICSRHRDLRKDIRERKHAIAVPYTWESFLKSKKECGLSDMILKGYVDPGDRPAAVHGHMYMGGYFIESTDTWDDTDARRQGKYYLILERDEFITDDLESLERKLYEYLIPEFGS